MQPTQRFVIFHRPGPAWKPDTSPLEQPGVAAHFEYLQSAFRAGRIEMAGPFPQGSSGGMIIMTAAATETDARALVQGDPGVTSGLILAEVRPWLITLA
jgi:uncharacterized protein YciI